MRHAIIFEENRLIDVLEDPADTGCHTMAATQIDIRIIFQHLAVPVHPLDYPSSGGTFYGIIRVRQSRAIRDNKEFFGFDLSYFGKYPLRGFLTIEYDQRNCCI